MMIAMAFDYIKEYPIAFFIQAITVPIYTLSFWKKDKPNQLIWQIVSCLLFALGYLFLSAESGIIISVFTAVILIVTYFLNKKSTTDKTVYYFLCMIAIVVSLILNVIFDKSIISWLAIIAGILNYYNLIFLAPNNYLSKSLFVMSHIMLITYEIIVKLPVFVLVDIIALISISSSLLLLVKDKKRTNRNKTI